MTIYRLELSGYFLGASNSAETRLPGATRTSMSGFEPDPSHRPIKVSAQSRHKILVDSRQVHAKLKDSLIRKQEPIGELIDAGVCMRRNALRKRAKSSTAPGGDYSSHIDADLYSPVHRREELLQPLRDAPVTRTCAAV